jgi:voltage-gated potassium channel
MEFTFIFLHVFVSSLAFVAPLLLTLALVITLMGQIVGRRESWTRFDALYWAFITATTVGYGDIRPMSRLSKALSVMIALVGMVFTGIMVALAVNAVTHAYDILKPDF